MRPPRGFFHINLGDNYQLLTGFMSFGVERVRRQSVRKSRWRRLLKAVVEVAWVYAIDLACEVPFFAALLIV